MGDINVKEYKEIKYYYPTEDCDIFYLGTIEDSPECIVDAYIDTSQDNFKQKIITLHSNTLFIYKPYSKSEQDSRSDSPRFLTFFVVEKREYGFQKVKRYTLYYNGRCLKIPYFLDNHGYSEYEVTDCGDLSDIFINKYCFIHRHDIRSTKGQIIGQVSGLLAREHAEIVRKYDPELAKENFGQESNGKNLLHIVDEFSLSEIGLPNPLERVEYTIDADNMTVVGKIYSHRQQKEIDIEKDLFQEFGGKYPAWAERLKFNESDLDATVVYGILEPIIDQMPKSLEQLKNEQATHILKMEKVND